MRARIASFLSIFQCVLFLAHWFLYKTWTAFWGRPVPGGLTLPAVLALLSMTFVTASALAWRYRQGLVRAYYTLAAAWLGTSSFCFLAACSLWTVYGGARLLGLQPDRKILAVAFFGCALLVSVYGMINASWTRVKRITVKLPNLPESWRGRVAALVTDVHLGHVRGYGFLQHIVAMLARLKPDIVFIGGDMYDGTAADVERLATPWARLTTPLGAYFVAGNHEEFSDSGKYLAAVDHANVRVLNNEKVTVDGLQIVGVHFRDSTNDEHFRAVLRRAAVDRSCASILLLHAPDRLRVASEEGISLQLSGHTHAGQFFPSTWITSRIYGKFVYGLNRLDNLLVYTSCGVGTWGPPMRIGTKPEIVLIRFE